MNDPKCTLQTGQNAQQVVADQIARDWLPDTGPCAVCGDTAVGARHRIADSIVEFVVTALGLAREDSV